MRYTITIVFKDYNVEPIVAKCDTKDDLAEWVGMIDGTVRKAYYVDTIRGNRIWLVKVSGLSFGDRAGLIRVTMDPGASERMRKSFNKLIR